MIWSSNRPTARLARDVDALIASEWDLEELHGPAVSADGAGAGHGDGHAAKDAPPEPDEAVLLQEQAYNRGHEDGRREGEKAEARRLHAAVVAAEQALDDVRQGQLRWTGSIEENVCALAVAVARQVVGREIETTPETIVELVKRALLEFPIDELVRIRVNPGDLEVIKGHGPTEDPLEITRGREARWVADARLAPGGCVVEGRERIVDGRVDTALERIYRRLTYTDA